MPIYTITSTVPRIFTYHVEAPDATTAIAMIDNDEADWDESSTDYDSSALEVLGTQEEQV